LIESIIKHFGRSWARTGGKDDIETDKKIGGKM
jgi:hypothetical protein